MYGSCTEIPGIKKGTLEDLTERTPGYRLVCHTFCFRVFVEDRLVEDGILPSQNQFVLTFRYLLLLEVGQRVEAEQRLIGKGYNEKKRHIVEDESVLFL